MTRHRWDEVIDRLPGHTVTLVEVGVWRGALAGRVLAARPQLQLVLVDPWLAGAANPSWLASGARLAQHTQAHLDEAYRIVLATVQPYADRVRILKRLSIEAAALVEEASCDAVFIDGNHAREAVAADLRAWLPKVRRGGWIGGHDYDSPRFPGVTAAVHEVFPAVDRGADGTWFAPVAQAVAA